MNRLKELRKEKDITLVDLSNDLGISRSTLNRYENGDSEPKRETWEKLASFFEVPVAYLMGISDLKEYKVNDTKEYSNLNNYDFGMVQYSDFQKLYSETLLMCDDIGLDSSLISESLFTVVNSLNLLCVTIEEDDPKDIEFMINEYLNILKEILELVSGFPHLEDKKHDIDEYVDNEIYTIDFLKLKNKTNTALDNIFVKKFLEDLD
ncbi:TPA: helix-turn-helix transcriptional regulator [Enterococcus hirae]|uniref:helix-turn-helix domain-containing protein n=1 Tax=Enterococcus hirae TaxID=1354 RepID=UPI000DE8BC8B|nr:helix-turn-helix transcriptional regulator [Enterococcus hirae]RBT59807.1 hypothetical protein EB45_02097 [Enterococcus hirae]